MNALRKVLILCLLASTPWSVLAEEKPDKSFSVELAKWQIARGDTLSEITQKLLPDNKPLRERLMVKILELNPIAFPTSNIDFMLAFNTLFFPSSIDGINIKQLLQHSIEPAKKSDFIESLDDLFFKDKEISSLEDDAVSVDAIKETPLYIASSEITAFNNNSKISKLSRFFSISNDNTETDLNTNTVALHDHQYITTGKQVGKLTITDGPTYLLEPNTRIKVYTQNNNKRVACQVNLIYGLIRVLEQSTQVKHCEIHTSLAKLSASNSAFVVQVCHQDNCIIESNINGKSTLPKGLYYGVVKGRIVVTDEIKKHQTTLGEINYYAAKNKKPQAIKHFKGLLFRDADLQAIEDNRPKKKQFAWGTIQSHPQDDAYIESHLDIKTDYSFSEIENEVETIQQEVLAEPDEDSDNSSNLERFN